MPNRDSQNKHFLSIEKTSLTSFVLNIVNTFFIGTSTVFMILGTKMEPEKLLIFPYSLIIHFTSLLMPCLIGASVTLSFYVKHRPLRVAILKHFFGVKQIDVIA